MPHTNRKKKTAGSPTTKTPLIQHTKRTEIEDTEGWTHIVDKPRTNSKKKPNTSLLHGGDFEIDGVSYINRTLEELTTDYEYWRKQWEESAACAELKQVISEGEGRRNVDNVVVLGLGSLQSSRREGRRASATQLAALQTMLPLLGSNLPVVLQDPQFTDLDKEFLASLGYTVVADPEAFDVVKEGSLVYAIHCYAKVYKAVSEGPRPAVLVGTDVGNFGKFDTSETIEDVAKSLEDLVEGCEVLGFPQMRHDFSDTKIYWRKVEEATEKEGAEVLPKSEEEEKVDNAEKVEGAEKVDGSEELETAKAQDDSTETSPKPEEDKTAVTARRPYPSSNQTLTIPGRSLHFSSNFVISCGTVTLDIQAHKVLIILCRKTKEYLLPKGRKDINEDTPTTAIRETYEETGYKCELLPHAFLILAPDAVAGSLTTEAFVVSQRTTDGVLKIIFWYLAQGDSASAKEEGTQMVDEDYESLWVGENDVLGMLTFDDDRAIAAKAMEFWQVPVIQE